MNKTHSMLERKKAKMKKKIVFGLLGFFAPLLVLGGISMMMIMMIGSGGTVSAASPMIESDALAEVQLKTSYCGVDWEEFLAYITVIYENDFTKVDFDKELGNFLIVRYVEYEKETKEIVDEEGNVVEVKVKWYKTNSGTLETKKEIYEFVKKERGLNSELDIMGVIDHLKELGSKRSFDIFISSKDVKDFYSDFDESQRDWYELLTSMNLIQETLGTYYELPDYVIVDNAGYFAWPVPNVNYVTSAFGWRVDPVYGNRSYHKGIDISSQGCKGKPVIASAAGTVIRVQLKNSGYGNNILIEHIDADGVVWRTMYAHLNQVEVREGEIVERGRVIGAVGSTGKSTGPHLHYEIQYQGTAVNPQLFVGQ